MKIGIVGNYGNNNNGDEAILLGILVQLETYYKVKRSDITVFSNQPEQTKTRYGVEANPLYYKKGNKYQTLLTTMSKNYPVVRKLDLLIIGGGGILMDLYGTEAFLFGMYGWLGKLGRTPVAIYGVGAGPILTKQGSIVLKSLAHLAKLVTVRDGESERLLQSIGVTSPIHVIGDPAFYVPKPENVQKNERPLQIGVTAVPYYHGSYWPEEKLELYEDYIEGMARNLDELLDKHPDAQINFFATKYPQDLEVTKDIKQRMKAQDRCYVHDQELLPEDIVAFTAKQDVVIGTRLHSLILSLVSGTPVMAIGYHHKVKDFMDMIGYGENAIAIEELNKQTVFFEERFAKMEQNWSKELHAFQATGEDLRERAIMGMRLIDTTIVKK
ncbi:polysaccharide pyruvyl transferase family protein [Radiobacillus deserti]|nr:polysaccharide pyruvyl transferase family protein [Radiobacillus deserti]